MPSMQSAQYLDSLPLHEQAEFTRVSVTQADFLQALDALTPSVTEQELAHYRRVQ